MNFRKIIQKEIPKTNAEVKEIISDPLLCDLLAQRGLTTANDVKEFLDCKNNPLLGLNVFQDAKKALDRIKTAIKNKEKILVWGDFDADGVTSSALMYKTLTRLGADFEIFIPNREEHGHGINSKVALQLAAKHKIKVMITVDCGISNAAEVKLLKSLGVDIIITDHHKLEGQTPEAFAILNPQAPNSLNEELELDKIKNLSRLAGVGVAYKLCLALLDKQEDEDLLTLACIGTISDVVPLLGENRTIVSRGLDLINKGVHKGVSMLFKSCGRENITSTDIAFILTPRINAIGRLTKPDLAFEFLIEENESALNFILEKLDNYNKIRQNLCDNIYLEASDLAKNTKNDSAAILYKEDWHIGIIGIVASKIVEDELKPAFLVTRGANNTGRCSIRSIEGYNVYEILKRNSELFTGYGGHSLAGGFSFDMSLHTFDEIKEAILKTIDELDIKPVAQDFLSVDKILNANEINRELIDTISILEPFGQDNPQPLFALYDTTLINSKIIGKNSNHLKFFCEKDGYGFECVKWNENTFEIPAKSKIDIAFSPRVNTFNNEENIQLEINDVYCESYKKHKKTDALKIFDHRKKTGILNQIADYLKREGLDITVWAKKIKTLEILKKYPQIENKIHDDNKKHNAIMFFDYPSNPEELREILQEVQPNKIHFMNDKFEENMENILKTLSGMLKFSHNHKDGQTDILKMAFATGTSEAFVQLALEIFENCGAIEILDVDKIRYIEPIKMENVVNNSLYELLLEEFQKIIDFKKHLAEDDLDKMYELVNICLK